MPGSRRRVRHIPIEEPLSFIARQRQNNRAAPTQHHRKNFGKISRCCSASLSGFVTAAAIYSRWPATEFLVQTKRLSGRLMRKRRNPFERNTVDP